MSRPISSLPTPGALVALSAGWARVRASLREVLSAYLLSLLIALPLAAALQAHLRGALGHQEAAARLLESWDGLWHQSFSARAEGLAATFDAGIVGIGAVLRSLDRLVQGSLLDLPAPLVIAGLLYLVGWVFLSGGLLARFRGEPGGLIAGAVRHFRPMLTIAAAAWVGFALVLGLVLPSLSAVVDDLCLDVIDERVHLAWVLAKYALVWALLLFIRVLADYARVAVVADPARGTGGGWRASAALLRRRARAVAGLLALQGLIGLGLLLAYWIVAPGVDQANPFKILIAFLISQTSVVSRVVMRGWSLASAQALFEVDRAE